MAPRRRPRSSNSRGFPSGLLWVLCGLAVLLFAGGYLLGNRRQSSPSPGEETSSAAEKPPARRAKKPSPPTAPTDRPPSTQPPATLEGIGDGEVAKGGDRSLPPRPPVGGARISLVIDDLGRSLRDLRQLANLGVEITYAVLPFESQTSQVVDELRREGREILCHLPMEPRNAANPGPGALRTSMSPKQLSRRTREALAAVPGAIGVNNHMGSSLTEDRRRMTSILEELQERRLFFLDSRTSAQSVGYELAQEMGIPTAQRQVFLDRDPSPEAIREQFERLLALARQRGAAIAIGHPYPSTLAVLAEMVPDSLEQGYEFVPVSFLLESSGSFE